MMAVTSACCLMDTVDCCFLRVFCWFLQHHPTGLCLCLDFLFHGAFFHPFALKHYHRQEPIPVSLLLVILSVPHRFILSVLIAEECLWDSRVCLSSVPSCCSPVCNLFKSNRSIIKVLLYSLSNGDAA